MPVSFAEANDPDARHSYPPALLDSNPAAKDDFGKQEIPLVIDIQYLLVRNDHGAGFAEQQEGVSSRSLSMRNAYTTPLSRYALGSFWRGATAPRPG